MTNSLMAMGDGNSRRFLTPKQMARARRAQQGAALDVFNHGLRAGVLAEYDRQDSQAAADACEAALDEELHLLDYGLHRANGSAAGLELVARKVQLLALCNDRRITLRFGR
jgi:hypothetical protein